MRSRLRGHRPSPALVVSVLALTVAVAGTAMAGVATISVLNKQEKKQAKKIANKQIQKKAPGLSVASAANATNATNAANATTAANANTLDGLDSSAFLGAGEVRNSGRVTLDDPTPGGTVPASAFLLDTDDIDVRFDCFQDFAASSNEIGRVEVLPSDGKPLSLSGLSSESPPLSHNLVDASGYSAVTSDAVINGGGTGNTVESGYFVAVHPDGAVVSGIASAEVNDPASPPGTDCTFGGTITGP
jgi:hypothetical protein